MDWTHRDGDVVAGVACVQFASEAEDRVGRVLVAQHQHIILRGIHHRFGVSIPCDVSIL